MLNKKRGLDLLNSIPKVSENISMTCRNSWDSDMHDMSIPIVSFINCRWERSRYYEKWKQPWSKFMVSIAFSDHPSPFITKMNSKCERVFPCQMKMVDLIWDKWETSTIFVNEEEDIKFLICYIHLEENPKIWRMWNKYFYLRFSIER